MLARQIMPRIYHIPIYTSTESMLSYNCRRCNDRHMGCMLVWEIPEVIQDCKIIGIISYYSEA